MGQKVSDEQYFAQLEQQMLGELEEDYPASWDYKEEQTIVGKVVAMRVATFTMKDTNEQKQSRIAVLEKSTGEKRTIWLTRVLSSQFGRESVAIGDAVAIKYLGMERPESGGNEYHNFKVVVRKPEGTAVDWSTLGGGGQRRASDPGGGDPGRDADFASVADDDIPF